MHEQVGIIHLTSFNARALRDVSAALDALQQKGAAELVLDLRDNRYMSLVVLIVPCNVTGCAECFVRVHIRALSLHRLKL